ncbi:putative Peptidoglycan domain protein [compost metagenome]
MANFTIAYSKTNSHEGGYSNNPNDRGGETWCGIARNFFPRWGGWRIIDEYKKSNPATFKQLIAKDAKLGSYVADFFKTEFWDKLSLDKVVNQAIANELYDTGVNMGIGKVQGFIQEALNLCNNNQQLYPNIKVDGKLGPITLQLINNHPNPQRLFNTLNILQGERYLNIIRNNETQEEFWGGWQGRVFVNAN